MILEDQYGVGDVIDTGEAIGTVEDVTLRITRVRDASGIVWYIRNGEITRIGNRSQGWSTALVDIQIGYDESLDRVLPLIREVAHELDGDEEWATGCSRNRWSPESSRWRAVWSPSGSSPSARRTRTSRSRGRSASGSRPLSTRPGSAPQVMAYGGA